MKKKKSPLADSANAKEGKSHSPNSEPRWLKVESTIWSSSSRVRAMQVVVEAAIVGLKKKKKSKATKTRLEKAAKAGRSFLSVKAPSRTTESDLDSHAVRFVCSRSRVAGLESTRARKKSEKKKKTGRKLILKHRTNKHVNKHC